MVAAESPTDCVGWCVDWGRMTWGQDDLGTDFLVAQTGGKQPALVTGDGRMRWMKREEGKSHAKGVFGARRGTNKSDFRASSENGHRWTGPWKKPEKTIYSTFLEAEADEENRYFESLVTVLELETPCLRAYERNWRQKCGTRSKSELNNNNHHSSST